MKSRKKSVQPRCHEANLANMKLLVSDGEFQMIVRDTRIKLKIPTTGLKDDPTYEKWLEEHYEACDEILLSQEYRDRGRAIFEDRDALRIDQDEFRRRMNRHNEEVPLNRLRAIEQFIIDKFDLPENYRDFIYHYILTGDVKAPYRNFEVSIVVEGDRTARRIVVTFFTIPTEEDMRLAKRAIEWQARYRGLKRYKPMKHIDRDLDIEKWYRQKERFDPVEQQTYRTTTAEIAEEHLGSAKKTDSVRYIVKDLEKARKKRFRARGKS